MKKLQQRNGREKGQNECAQGTVERGSPSQDESPHLPHPCYMTDEEFNTLPCWSDVEDDPAYNVRYRPRLAVSGAIGLPDVTDPEHRGLYPQNSSPARSVPLPRSGPPGFSSTPQFVGVCEAISVLSLKGARSDRQDQLSLSDRASPSSICTNPYSIGTIEEPTCLDLADTRLRPHISHLQNSGGRSSFCRGAAPRASSNDERRDVYHVGDGLSPRDPLQQSITRNRDGESEAQIVAPDRPPIDSELNSSSFTNTPHIRLQGGAGSEDRDHSRKRYTPHLCRANPPSPVTEPSPDPEDRPQSVLLQGDYVPSPSPQLPSEEVREPSYPSSDVRDEPSSGMSENRPQSRSFQNLDSSDQTETLEPPPEGTSTSAPMHVARPRSDSVVNALFDVDDSLNQSREVL